MPRPALLVLVLCAAAAAEEPLAGKVLRVRGPEVTLLYDFEDEAQLRDFAEVRPPHLPAGGELRAKVDGGRLLLEGTGALLHRRFGLGACRVEATLRVVLRGNEGLLLAGQLPGRYLLLNLYDRGQKRDGGLLLTSCEPGTGKDPVIWRPLASAGAGEVDKQIQGDAPAVLEFSLRGVDAYLRLGDVYRQRRAPALDLVAPGFWVHEAALAVDEMTVTLLLDCTPAPAVPATVAGLPETKLAKLVLDAPISADAAAARLELSLRGPAGWKQLESLTTKLEKKQPWAAAPVVEALASGLDDERRAHLLALWKRAKAPEIRLALLLALAEWYPQDAELLHAGLREGLPGRLRLLRALVPKGLPVDALKPLTEDAELSADAAAVLADRGASLEEAELGRLPRIRALEGFSPAACRAFLKEFGDAPNWALLEALVDLLDDNERDVAKGAHMLLLTVSGKDIAPVKDLWRSWIAAKRGTYTPPHLSEPGVVTAAITRGVDFLRRDLLQDGQVTWPVRPDWPGVYVGGTALAVYALRSSGVPADDPAVRKAVEQTLVLMGPDGRPALRGDLEGYTYALSLLAMALESVDKAAHKQPLEVLARRLADGQLENGQWTYYCKPKDYDRRPPAGDNSNTQYAILGLRSCRRAGVEVDRRIWERNAAFWQSSLNPKGGWGYGPKGSFDHEFSMTAAGVATLGICTEALHGLKAWDLVRGDVRIVSGMRRLGELLLDKGFEGQEIYAYYGVERAAILTGTAAFDDFDWYKEGAGILVATQKESGAWGKKDPHGITEGDGYGEGIDTAYALLFLKRAVTAIPGAESGAIVRVRKK